MLKEELKHIDNSDDAVKKTGISVGVVLVLISMLCLMSKYVRLTVVLNDKSTWNKQRLYARLKQIYKLIKPKSYSFAFNLSSP